MRFQTALGIAGCSAWMWGTAIGASEVAEPPIAKLQQLIEALADPKFKNREEASRELWALGDSALEDLKKASESDDPERAFRAREIVRKIQLFITPDTDPEVAGLVERYQGATVNEKYDLFAKMHRKRAWRQLLKLYASESEPQVQTQFEGSMPAIAVVAARERLMVNDLAGARELLEMAPVNPAGLLSLAEFHRQQGTLDAELERAKKLQGLNGAAWRLALYRASGDHEAAKAAALEAGQPGIASVMSILAGDPVPWLRLSPSGARGGSKLYADLAIKRWEGKARPADFEPLAKLANSRNEGNRNLAIGALLLLGENASAEQALVEHDASVAFDYFDALERIPEALSALGLDPDHPDYAAWVNERFAAQEDPEIDEEHGEVDDFAAESTVLELAKLANFMERRGLNSESFEVFAGPMEALAARDETAFLSQLGELFGSGGKSGSPFLASRIAARWAGNDAGRWEDVVASIAGGEDEVKSLWAWLPDLDAKATPPERMDALLALCGMGADPNALEEKWLAKAWKVVEETPVAERGPMITRMTYLANIRPNATHSLRIWEMASETGRNERETYWTGRPLDLSATGRWEEAAAYYVGLISRIAGMKGDPQPELHAYAAAALRRAGKEDEAATHDAIAEKLALGRDARGIADAYAFGYDYDRAAKWWVRSVMQADPDGDDFGPRIVFYQRMLMENEKWKEAAAASEVMAAIYSTVDMVDGGSQDSALVARQYRFHSDMTKALANLESDREGTIATLARCHRDYMTDGGIADHFFPGIRSAGLLKEHDEWFKLSWNRMMDVVQRFPESDNVANTTGWLASRAQRMLPESEKLLEKALSHHPGDSAYLDTMAEIQFAKGNRAKALEWSSKAVNASPQDTLIRRQYERFRTAPVPRPGA